MEMHSYTSEVMIMPVLNALPQAISRIKSRPEVSDSGQVTQQEQSAHQPSAQELKTAAVHGERFKVL